MASLFLSGLYTPFSAPNPRIHKKGAVATIPRKATNGTASHHAIRNRNRCQFQSSCWYSTTCFCSEFFSSCMNISSHNHSINGYWVGPDIEDGWGYVEAFVNLVARL